jgi:hypothetical protein
MVLSPVPAWGVAASVVVLITVEYLVLFAPFRRRRAYRELVATNVSDPEALTRFYQRTVMFAWTWLLPIGLVLALAPALHPGNLGFAWPIGPQVFRIGSLVATALVTSVVFGDNRQLPLVTLMPVRALRLRTRAEHRLALVAFVIAALVEPPVTCGLLVAAGLSYGLPPLAVIIAAGATFGLGYLYQGWLAVALIGFVGAMMCLSVVLTGSLLFAMIAHVLLNVRAYVALAAASRTAERDATAMTA